jgi:hypothetical protein
MSGLRLFVIYDNKGNVSFPYGQAFFQHSLTTAGWYFSFEHNFIVILNKLFFQAFYWSSRSKCTYIYLLDKRGWPIILKHGSFCVCAYVAVCPCSIVYFTTQNGDDVTGSSHRHRQDMLLANNLLRGYKRCGSSRGGASSIL